MQTDAQSFGIERPGPDLAAVLALVAANVPLPKATLAALRLAGKATKLSVDQSITEIAFSTEGSAQLRVGSSLTSGLTSLHFNGEHYQNIAQPLNVFQIASNSSSTMVSLDLNFWPGKESDRPQLLARLGACEWPVLRSSSTFCTSLTFHEHIKIDSMPSLTKLCLNGLLSPLDVTALARGQHFASSVQHLEIDIDATRGFYDSLEELLQGTSQLTNLNLITGVDRSVDIGFLAAAELPKLEVFELSDFYVDSFEPIFCRMRPRLRSLDLWGDLACTCCSSVGALLSRGAATLSALTHLELPHSYENNWRFLREMRLGTLKSLKLHMPCKAAADVAHLAEALTHLPRLEILELGFDIEVHGNNGVNPEWEAELIRELFATVTLPHLRQLNSEYFDTSESLLELIKVADHLPQLEDLDLHYAEVGSDGFEALAEAGLLGHWPRLKAFRSRIWTGFENASWQEKEEEARICQAILQ